MFDLDATREVPTSQMTPEAAPSQGLSLVQPQKAMLSIVIVVWNAKNYVVECLDSLKEYLGDIQAEVIIVDNASTDGSPELVSERYPDFRLIRNTENLGFAKANNLGIAQTSGEYLCLVNSDVKFTGDCFSPMLRYLAENPAVAMLGPKMLNADGKAARSTMRFPTIWNSFSRAIGLDLVFRRSALFGGYLMADFDHQRTIPVQVLNGWFLLIRRSALERVGLLDPQFFMYGEDVDWCYRFRKAGQVIVFFAEAEAIHYGGASAASAPVRFNVEMHRANLQYWRKHRGWFAQQLYLLSLVVYDAGRIFGLACSYACSASNRPSTVSKIKRSLACLQWTIGTLRGKEGVDQVRGELASKTDVKCAS
jgi:GT2 family glycosyltransferase